MDALTRIDRWSVAAISILIYLAFVRFLRYRRATTIPLKHGIHCRSDFPHLTVDQAQDVLKDLVELEFPKLMGFSIVFALFKTYGIPSVSSLLVTTGELASPETASKRTADTGVLLLEFCLNKPSSFRAKEAIARMNYLHSRYIKAGKISNNDMLYTLSVFALEPVRWIDKYEWRQFSDLERCATGTFWKAMGDKMNIDYSALPNSANGWLDGLEWYEAVRQWSEQYERDHMFPAEVNHRLVLAHLDVIFLNIPKKLRVVGRYIVAVAAGPRLRRAMLFDQPPAWFACVIEGVLLARKYIVRHLLLPRMVRKSYVSEEPESNGRYSSKEYLSHPWYVTPTFKRRWGPRAWMTRMMGRKLPGDDGNRYNPEGYVIKEIGPKGLRGKGTDYMDKELERLDKLGAGTCPFHLPKA